MVKPEDHKKIHFSEQFYFKAPSRSQPQNSCSCQRHPDKGKARAAQTHTEVI